VSARRCTASDDRWLDRRLLHLLGRIEHRAGRAVVEGPTDVSGELGFAVRRVEVDDVGRRDDVTSRQDDLSVIRHAIGLHLDAGDAGLALGAGNREHVVSGPAPRGLYAVACHRDGSCADHHHRGDAGTGPEPRRPASSRTDVGQDALPML